MGGPTCSPPLGLVFCVHDSRAGWGILPDASSFLPSNLLRRRGCGDEADGGGGFSCRREEYMYSAGHAVCTYVCITGCCYAADSGYSDVMLRRGRYTHAGTSRSLARSQRSVLDAVSRTSRTTHPLLCFFLLSLVRLACRLTCGSSLSARAKRSSRTYATLHQYLTSPPPSASFLLRALLFRAVLLPSTVFLPL